MTRDEFILNRNVSADELCRFIMTRGDSNDRRFLQDTSSKLFGQINAENRTRRGSMLQVNKPSNANLLK